MATTTTIEAVHTAPGRRALFLGLALAAAGIIGYAIQIVNQRLITPWYMPCLATAGAALVVAALWRRRSVWRVLSLLLLLLLAGAEWAFLLGMRLPGYEGPLAVGRQFPAFETIRADGTPFANRDLSDGKNCLLVFFRGRW
jgi:hypothetical protein